MIYCMQSKSFSFPRLLKYGTVNIITTLFKGVTKVTVNPHKSSTQNLNYEPALRTSHLNISANKARQNYYKTTSSCV